MDLIELINLEENSYTVNKIEDNSEVEITNIDLQIIAGHYDFIVPERRVANNTYIKICDGNITDQVGDSIAAYILQSTGEGAHYLISVDDFNREFEELN